MSSSKKQKAPALFPAAPSSPKALRSIGMTGYRAFDQDGKDLRETKQERKEFDDEMKEGLLKHWEETEAAGQGTRAGESTGREEKLEIVDLIESSASPSLRIVEGPPKHLQLQQQMKKQNTEPALNSQPQVQVPPGRSRTLPDLSTTTVPGINPTPTPTPILDPDEHDPFLRSTLFHPHSQRPGGKPSAAMLKLLEDHAKFEKKELKNKMRGSRSKVFEGCVVGVVMSQKAFNSLRDKWNLLLLHGGTPVIRYTPQVTHIVSDPDVDEPAFLKFLGVASREELSETVRDRGVSYEWVSTCIRTRVLQPLEPYFLKKKPKIGRGSTETSFGFGAGSMAMGVGVAGPGPGTLGIAGKKRELSVVEAIRVGKRTRTTREITPTDSDTQASRSLQRMEQFIPVQPESVASVRREEEEDDQYKRRFGLEPGVPADPLDEIIMGVKMGTVDIDEGNEELLRPALAPAKLTKKTSAGRTGDEDDGTDDEDPKHAAAKGQALRAAARRQAHKLRAETTDGPHKAQQDHDGKTGRDGPNEDIALALEELAKLYRDAVHKNKFSRESYQKVANIVRNVPYRIESGKQAQEIKGIGAQMAERASIQEYIDHGRTMRAVFEDTPESRAVAAFGKIYGVGPALAHSLVARGARTLDDLRNNPDKYGLTGGHRFGLKFYDDLNERIPRDEVTALFESIKRTALKIEPKLQIDPMGSYRRGEDTSGDLDILISRDPSDGGTHSGVILKLVKELVAQGIICHTVSTPSDWAALECKWMGTGRLTPSSKLRRIDILATPHEQYGAALIYFTGNDRFNRSLRYYANRQGYSLNQRGLYKGVLRDANRVKQTEGTLVASKTEQDIFDVLRIRWRPPHLRRP